MAGMWDYMNSLFSGAPIGGGPGYNQPAPTGGLPQAFGGGLGNVLGSALPQFPRIGGNFADLLRGWQSRGPRPAQPAGSFSPFSIGGVPQFFNPGALGAPQAAPMLRAQPLAQRTGSLNVPLPDMFGGGRGGQVAPWSTNPNVRLMLPQRGVPNLPTLPPMNWGGGYNGGF